MRFELFVANRLSLGQQKRQIGLKVSVVGVALAFAVMIVSMSVIGGFKNEIRRKVTGFEPQVKIEINRSMADGAMALRPMALDAATRRVVEQAAPGATTEEIIELQTLLKTDSAFAGIVIRCADPQADFSFIESAVTAGEWHRDSITSLALSETTARRLGVGVGDRIFAHFLTGGSLRTRRLTIDALYNTNFDDYDAAYAFGNLDLGRSVNGWSGDECSYITLSGLDDESLDQTAAALNHGFIEAAVDTGGASFDGIPTVSTSNERGAIYFNWLSLLDTNVVVITALMAVVSAFTLISSLFILILQRIPMIGLMKALGATDSQIQRVFVVLAQRILVRGLLYGNIVAAVIILVQHFFRLIPLDPDSYYLSYVPVEINIPVWLLVNVATVVFSFLVLVVPSRVIASLDPAEALRFDESR